MNNLPSNIADNESTWIEYLVDDELGYKQTQQLFAYLESNPQSWKSVAVALLDDRVLETEIGRAFEVGQTEKVALPEKQSLRDGLLRSSWFTALVASLALLMGALGYHLMQSDSNISSTVQDDIPDVNFPELVEIPTPVSFLTAYQPNSLIEVENTPSRAVYYVDHEVPKFLIRAIALAGHEMNVRQKMVHVEGPDGEPIQVPMNMLEIEKYATRL